MTRAHNSPTSTRPVSPTHSFISVQASLNSPAALVAEGRRAQLADGRPPFAVSVCCPSRSSFFRAQAAHNTNITSVSVPYGGWEIFVEKGYNGHYLPSFLQQAGYATYYTGKVM